MIFGSSGEPSNGDGDKFKLDPFEEEVSLVEFVLKEAFLMLRFSHLTELRRFLFCHSWNSDRDSSSFMNLVSS